MPNSLLLPAPRTLTFTEGTYTVRDALILIDSDTPQTLLFSAQRLQHKITETHKRTAAIVAYRDISHSQVGITLRHAPKQNPQGYELTITPDHILIEGDDAGCFYGVCTLMQILEWETIRCLTIKDHPDFPVRGLMLDVSRDKVPTMQTMYALVELLAGWKTNQIQLYTEHTFAYHNHREVWAEASPFTAQEILELDAFCRERFIELVPNQNSFGHMARWLVHPRYGHLAETHEMFSTPWGNTMKGPFSLCPLDDGSLVLMRELFDELLPHFTSKMFNVGCDETIDVGQGRSKEAVEKLGAGRVYLDYLKKIYSEVTKRNHTMQFWGDIIVEYPELISELPKDAIALEWGYEAQHPFDDHGAKFAASGIPFYVCPGTSSWNTIAGRTDNALGNLRNAAENGLKHGAVGYLNTDWGDRGHWQPLPVSYLGFAGGAAYSWCLTKNGALDLAQAVSKFAFKDDTGNAGVAAYRLGNIYQQANVIVHNGSEFFWTLQTPLADLGKRKPVSNEALGKTQELIKESLELLAQAKMTRADATLIRHEYDVVGRLLTHACQRRLLHNGEKIAQAQLNEDLREIIFAYEHMWLARNRLGGMKDSVQRLEKMKEDYK